MKVLGRFLAKLLWLPRNQERGGGGRNPTETGAIVPGGEKARTVSKETFTIYLDENAPYLVYL